MENTEMTTEHTEAEKEAILREALSRVVAHVENSEGNEGNSILGRLEQFASLAPENESTNVASIMANEITKEGLESLTDGLKEIKKEMENPDLVTPENEGEEKDPKEKGRKKDKENDNENEGEEREGDEREPREKEDNEKDKDEREDAPAKTEERKRETLSKVKLPSGMEVRQEGPSWVLVSEDGRQRTDITDVVEAIDKYNRGVDATNEESRVQDEAQTGVENVAQRDGVQNPEASDDRVKAVAEALPEVKDVNGNDVFKPEDVEAFAKLALTESDLRALEGKGLSDKLADKKRENNEQEEEGQQRAQAQQLAMAREHFR